MAEKRKIEIFGAGCPACEEAVQTVNEIACPTCEIDVAAKAKEYGIRSVPTVVIDGKLADCCSGRGVDAEILKANDVGVPVS